MSTDDQKDPLLVKVYGWKEIAAELQISTRNTRKFAARERDPLPIEYGHKGVWAYRHALVAWIRRQNVPYQAHLRLLSAKRELARAKMAPARDKRARMRGQATSPSTKRTVR
jgi:hypothetical protein